MQILGNRDVATKEKSLHIICKAKKQCSAAAPLSPVSLKKSNYYKFKSQLEVYKPDPNMTIPQNKTNGSKHVQI